MTPPVRLGDQRGTTITELIVGMAAGGVVLFAVTALLLGTIHQTARVSARVDATQRARIALNKVIDQLHSACLAPQIAPVQAGSTGTSLSFIHQAGGAAVLTPVLSKISLSEGTLSQSDYAMVPESLPPKWEFAETASSTRQLMTKIAPISPASSIFTYSTYVAGQGAPVPVTIPPGEALSEETAARVIQVGVAFTASPLRSPVTDAEAPTSVRASAPLRLTPASYNKEVVSPPCQ